MKTYRQFRQDAIDALENLVLEAKGFGNIAKTRREKKKKNKKQKETDLLSPREAKIRKLERVKSHWQGLR